MLSTLRDLQAVSSDLVGVDASYVANGHSAEENACSSDSVVLTNGIATSGCDSVVHPANGSVNHNHNDAPEDNGENIADNRYAFRAKLRVNVSSIEELDTWRTEFAHRSKTTMRFANTSSCTGRKTLFKVFHFKC